MTVGSAELLVFVGTWSGDRNEGIHSFTLDTNTGDLESVGHIATIDPFHLAISSDQRFLYGTNSDQEAGEGTVSAFAITASGALSFLNEQPSGGALPCYVSVNDANTRLLVGNYESGNVALLSIEPDGTLGELADTVQHEGSGPRMDRQSQAHVHSFLFGPGERFAYSADLGADRVFIYRFDADTAELKPDSSVSVQSGAGPRHIAFHPNGRFAYVINELDNTINVYDHDPETGTLTDTQSISTLAAGHTDTSHTADVQVHPSGKFLYATNRGHDSIAIFAVDEDDGRITDLGREPARGEVPWSIAIDPTGNFITSANTESNNVSVFRIDRDTGLLQPVGTPATAARPTCVKMLLRR